jgi:hypothetical protein
MLWVSLAAGLIGTVCGCFFRAPALVALSFFAFSGAMVTRFITDGSVGGAIVSAFLVTAALQGGYLLGFALRRLWRRLRGQSSRPLDFFDLRRLFRVLTGQVPRSLGSGDPSSGPAMPYPRTLAAREESAG